MELLPFSIIRLRFSVRPGAAASEHMCDVDRFDSGGGQYGVDSICGFVGSPGNCIWVLGYRPWTKAIIFGQLSVDFGNNIGHRNRSLFDVVRRILLSKTYSV